MKKTMMLWLALVLAATLAAQAESRDTAGAILHGQGLLWKIEKPGVATSYIFGTMHVSDARVTQLPAPVEQAFSESQQFAMEMLPGPRAMEIISQGSYFQDGRNLKAVMQADDFQRLSQLMQQQLQLPEKTFTNLRPWVVLMLLIMPPDTNSNSVLDVVLYQRAQQRGIDLYGLETAQQQLDAMESLSLDEQIWLLNKTVHRFPQIASEMQQMTTLYLQRDLAAVLALELAQMDYASDIDDKFLYNLLEKRNHYMAQRIQALLQKEKVFVAIGALHLPGETGVLHLLEQQGFKVTAVY